MARTKRESREGARSLLRRCSLTALSLVACILGGCRDAREEGPRDTIDQGVWAEAHDWSGPRVVLLGIDGATWDVVDPMIARGELPNFAALLKRGARASFITHPPSRSPVVWTTIASGRVARVHNILDFTYPYETGPQRLVESTLRRVPAIWNVASMAGRSVDVVSYFVSYPAEEINGIMVSDRALDDVEGGVWPPDALAPFTPELDALRDETVTAGLLRRFVDWEYDPEVRREPEHPLYEATRIIHQRVDRRVVRDEYTRRVTAAMLPRESDLLVTYYRLVDHVSHAAWKYYDDSDFAEKPTPENQARLGKLVEEAYRYTDECLGDIVREIGDDANLVIVSDHGFGSATGPYETNTARGDRRWLSGNHRQNGFFLAAGPDIKPGVVYGVTALDIAPVLCALLDLPISDELEGRVPEQIFREEFLARRVARPTREVPTYENVVRNVPHEVDGSGDQEETLEMLESLGYISTDGAVSATGDLFAIDSHTWNCGARTRHPVLVGEFLAYAGTGNTAKMHALATQLKKRVPGDYRRIINAVPEAVVREIEPRLDVAHVIDRSNLATPSDEGKGLAGLLVASFLRGDYATLDRVTAEILADRSAEIPAILDHVVRSMDRLLWSEFVVDDDD